MTLNAPQPSRVTLDQDQARREAEARLESGDSRSIEEGISLLEAQVPETLRGIVADVRPMTSIETSVERRLSRALGEMAKD
ncbi:MAG: hypothetical protein KDD64_01800 [Bdellovibrionales bacterium]|nr:hypothetical protein [Bdellovibrionales bacterium]